MTTDGRETAVSPFADLSEFLALPRVSSLAISPDGSRLVTVVSEQAADGKTWQGSLWEVDPQGKRPARRLTRAAKTESSPVFATDGSVLFVSSRADQEAKPEDSKAGKSSAALWLLPPTGEARQVYAPKRGVQTVRVARDAGTLLVTTSAHPDTPLGEADEEHQKAREDAGVTAILHEAYPVRYWDHDLGPDQRRLGVAAPMSTEDGRLGDLTDVTSQPDGRIGESTAISPDGRWVVYYREVEVSPGYGPRGSLRLVPATGGEPRTLADQEQHTFEQPVFTPDSSAVICVRYFDSTKEEPPNVALIRVDLATGELTELAPDFPDQPDGPMVSPSGDAVYFFSTHKGHRPVWRLDLASGDITRLTASGHYTDLQVSPDGSALYALRDAIDHPAQPVRLDPTLAEQDPVPLLAPGALDAVPGTLTEIETTVADGRTVRSWLVLPEGASADRPAPLLLWVHGGPMMSWNGWTWRWNPWTAAARGYAVLLPDPALSTGYGQDFIRAGWGAWGAAPFTDLMAITDVAVARPDIDGNRTAAMGGSFGGYMANWIATQTSRFRAIVTHASLWNLDAFTGSTDSSYYWMREMGDPLADPERIAANSPHLRVADIKTPMLVIHGDKDYRVPIGEGLRLYFDLVRHGVDAKFLYFPTENHWVLTPGNARVWYETVFAFLAEHVLDEPWRRPELI
ncbi:S9 family peptidase [Solihabitans fulvus]|uniref:S9 family peptidase n=1 Tax=Solihabitans fulvus TaxID=1892852 RepID=A0A5B2WV32_9PSEU|nr:S9 family peptidase [Solihabitans fulvus]KAA2254888.1 S9 family peptidase [Solihabitans fulvus]